MTTIHLKAGKELAVARRHPWLFKGALDRVSGNPSSGETVDVVSAGGQWLARGAWSPHSQISVRIWTMHPEEAVDEAFFRRRLAAAIAVRQRLLADRAVTGVRLVNAESDGLPGLIVDRYADWLVCQFLSAGAVCWQATIVRLLGELVSSRGIYERSDVGVREKEGLPLTTGVLAGEPPPPEIVIAEDACRYPVDIVGGQKTGFYLDQRDNRALVGAMAEGATVLNAFCYSGGFGIAALHGGAAQVTQLDVSGPALALAHRTAELNGLPADRLLYEEADVFTRLRHYRDSRRNFDLIVLDPPKFAESRHQIDGACRGYKDINLLACKLLRPGGLLFTFSCSGAIDPDLFQKVIAGAAADAGRDLQILRRLEQAADHPTALHFPEGHYLKGLLCRAID